MPPRKRRAAPPSLCGAWWFRVRAFIVDQELFNQPSAVSSCPNISVELLERALALRTADRKDVFLLREIESSLAHVKDARWYCKEHTVTLYLPVSKTDP